VPARPSHLPTNSERDALQRLRASGEMTLKALGPTTHRVVLKMIVKGWVEHGSESRTYRITAEGDAALRAKMPLR
jgi:DNA-binding IclR family transcriptional regulator